MPSRNVEKEYVSDTYYHVFNRGVNKRSIFKDDKDYAVFLNLLKRYLGEKPVRDKSNREYPWFRGKIQLLSFCLMPNHYHLLVYQQNDTAMTDLMRSVCTSYTRYFNKRHKRVGHLFQDRFKASRINSDEYLLHISRYIHLNPRDYKSWQFSSLPYYLGQKHSSWLDPKPMLDLFEGESYIDFVEDYESQKALLEEIKSELANS